MRILTILSLLATLAAVTAATAETRPLDADTLWQIQRLGAPALSPDGSVAALPVTRYDVEANEGTTDLWLVPTGDGEARRLTTGTATGGRPVWSPDGKHLAFVAKRGDDEQDQIYVLPIGGGEARRVTDVPTGVHTPKWLPDSSGLVFISRVWTDLDGWDAQAERMTEREESKMTGQVCREPLHHHRADDGPAYPTILIVGHLMPPLLLIVFETWRPEPLTLFTIFAVGCIGLSLYLLPRLKGAIVAFQWARGMHGFGGDTA